MIVEQLTRLKNDLIKNDLNYNRQNAAVATISSVIERYEKLFDDVCAAAAIDSNERVTDLLEEEMEEV